MGEYDSVVAALEAAYAKMLRRNRFLAEAGLRRSDDPPLTVTIERAGEVLNGSPRAVELAERIARMGRNANVVVQIRDGRTAADFGGSLLLRDMVLAQQQ